MTSAGYNDLNFLVVGTLYLRDEAIFKEYFDWTRTELVPNLLSTDEFLRGRYFTATRTLLADSATPVERAECANTMALFELNSDDFLWDKFLDVATSPRWLQMEPYLVCLHQSCRVDVPTVVGIRNEQVVLEAMLWGRWTAAPCNSSPRR